MDIIICIICNNNIEYINIKNTWYNFNSNEFTIYFIINSKYNIGYNNNYIYMDSIDHFNIINYFKSIQYKYLLISYYNSYINLINLKNFIYTINIHQDEPIYIGGHGDYRIINNIKFWFHSYQPGIIINKMSSEILSKVSMQEYNNLPNNDLQNLSGVALGYYSHLYNINIIHNNNFSFCNWNGIPCHPNTINKNELICCANMSINDIINYYQYLNNNNTNDIYIRPRGGLGNLLFQYFLGYSLKKQYNRNVYYQINYNYWRGDINNYKIFKHLDFIDFNTIDLSDCIILDEIEYKYKNIILENNKYKISGYYQSYKYSENYIDEIKDLLFNNINSEYLKIENLYNKLINNKQSCLIHVRHGDYLYFQNVHPILDNNYYINALNIISNCKYFIFSDDEHFIKQWDILKNIDYEIIYLQNPEEILIFMSLCDNFIIANSTLSLAAYLLRKNKNAQLIAPKEWFASSITYNIHDYIPSNGILI